MKDYFFIDAISCIDDDLLEKHLKRRAYLKNKKSRKKVTTMIWLKSSIAVAAVFLIIASVSAIWQYIPAEWGNKYTESNDNSSNNGFSTNVPTDSSDDNHTATLPPDIDIKSGVADLYNLTEYSSVVSVEKTRVLGTYLVDMIGAGNFKCVVLECKVLSDFYDKIQNGTTIYVPIPIVATVESTLQLIDSYDYFMFYIARLYDEVGIDMTTMDQETLVLRNVSMYASMSMHEVLPIQNGVVSTDTMYTLLDNASISYLPVNEIAGYEEFIANGMALETVETHFRYLKTAFESGNLPVDPNQNKDDLCDY